MSARAAILAALVAAAAAAVFVSPASAQGGGGGRGPETKVFDGRRVSVHVDEDFVRFWTGHMDSVIINNADMFEIHRRVDALNRDENHRRTPLRFAATMKYVLDELCEGREARRCARFFGLFDTAEHASLVRSLLTERAGLDFAEDYPEYWEKLLEPYVKKAVGNLNDRLHISARDMTNARGAIFVLPDRAAAEVLRRVGRASGASRDSDKYIGYLVDNMQQHMEPADIRRSFLSYAGESGGRLGDVFCRREALCELIRRPKRDGWKSLQKVADVFGDENDESGDFSKVFVKHYPGVWLSKLIQAELRAMADGDVEGLRWIADKMVWFQKKVRKQRRRGVLRSAPALPAVFEKVLEFNSRMLHVASDLMAELTVTESGEVNSRIACRLLGEGHTATECIEFLGAAEAAHSFSCSSVRCVD